MRLYPPIAGALLLLTPLASSSFRQGEAGDKASPVADASRPADVDALFERFARMPGLQADFAEEKHLSLLALPLKSRGVIYFLPPGHLTRIIHGPAPTRLCITPDELRMIDVDGEQVVDLNVNDPVRAFVTSLLGIFAGDRTRLERSFAIEYVPIPSDDVHWVLRLTPRAEPLSRWMTSLELHGERTRIRHVELSEPNGDRTRTTLLDVDPQRTFDVHEKLELFGLKGKDRAAPNDRGAGARGG